MTDSKLKWKSKVHSALLTLADRAGISADLIPFDGLVGEFPPKPELGDIGFPLFGYSKLFRKAPAALASEVAAILAEQAAPGEGRAAAQGPYLNVYLDRAATAQAVLKRGASPSWIEAVSNQGEKIMVEFSCPNTNKPLHLGHLRNNVLGESLSRILKAAGADVLKVNLINDRGVHICKSMLAYQVYGGGRTPEDEGLKSDHFVGKYYVKFNELKAEDPKAEEKAQDLLRRWEAGDPEVMDLWKKMNAWAVEGIKTTYARQGVSFDRYYYEHETYMKGVSEVLKGLEEGIFYREDDGSVWVNLEDIGLDRKVLLRKDGTSLYITQDIGTAINRHDEWPFERLVYVVASEQQYHFKVLFEVLKRLGYAWASKLHHLAYGLVNLPSGRMKTREGTVVDADDLIDELSSLAKAEIVEKGRDELVGDLDGVAGKVALGALHYYLLQTTPTKDMLYDPKQSLSFAGNTGPYIQYMGARACSILRKWEALQAEAPDLQACAKILSSEADWALLRRLAAFPENLEQAARTMEPSVMAAYAHEVASDFSAWYRDNPVLNCSDKELSAARAALVVAAKATLETLCGLLCIPFLEAM
jgi:arginyl-tRNA synthetase